MTGKAPSVHGVSGRIVVAVVALATVIGVSRSRATQPSIAIADPGSLIAEEEEDHHWTFAVSGAARVFIEGLPPGATWDEVSRSLRFRPDFVQGGRTWSLRLTAWSDGQGRGPKVHRTVPLTVIDSIVPPSPRVVVSTPHRSYQSLMVVQDTDDWLDSPGYAGRTFYARIIVPKVSDPDDRVPIQVSLHGFGARRPSSSGSGDRFRIYPMDPSNTYWWGYADVLPLPPVKEVEPEAPGTASGTKKARSKRRKGKKARRPPRPIPAEGQVNPYTQRRVLHLLDWVLRTYPWADPDAVYVQGSSMGGAGALKLGLLRARHFAYVSAAVGQAIARNHRAYRLRQLSRWWGMVAADLDDDQGRSVWDAMDMTWVYMHYPASRDQYVKVRHGKDDPVIHFGAAVQASEITGRSLYQAFQDFRVGHYAVWDEAGHSGWDPVLGPSWSSAIWDRIRDPVTYLRRNLAFPAFSRSSGDGDPGGGRGNGEVKWRDGKGFSADPRKPGDTGWAGDIAGAFNRFLRWDATSIIDTHSRFEIALRHTTGVGARSRRGYPARGDRPDVPLPIVVDVTPRRVQAFQCLPGEVVAWSYGMLRGTVMADAMGAVTVPRLPVGPHWVRLALRRQ